ncbi:TetR/AcrR family transcriptional regulator [Ureibacillus thermophilus]|uniref:TetR/AcrR family transcriptional regulator n=1 Tax=Ureibacillus thermophilus TaxID=367743 RepID=A0A4P6UTC9_9BACL|nr:TetR/AcrR family transcriptional regulator [Ureibacillus thermophilus]QBK25987.1 TetR/AcrR family transcriptional regulator [Ureibacillus thermophilus]
MKKTLKQRILETSLHLFQQYGYHGVTVDEIVAEAGTSKGGFYHNYKSKDELLYEIHDVFISYVIEKAELSYKENHTPVLKLAAILHSFIKVFDMYKPYITVFYEESAYLNEEFKQIINEKRDRYRKLLEKVISEGQQSGDFRKELPANIVTMAIIGMINWTYKWFKQDGPLSMEEITAIFKDLILRSIVTEQGLEEAKQLHQLLNL